MNDSIRLKSLRVSTHLGITQTERTNPQDVEISLILTPQNGLRALDDQINNTLDYYQLSLEVEALAQDKPRHLLETLAEDLYTFLMKRYQLSYLRLEIEKFILPNAQSVSVVLESSPLLP